MSPHTGARHCTTVRATRIDLLGAPSIHKVSLAWFDFLRRPQHFREGKEAKGLPLPTKAHPLGWASALQLKSSTSGRPDDKIVRQLEANNRLRRNLNIPIPRQATQRRAPTRAD
jgi:hypothetical protein